MARLTASPLLQSGLLLLTLLIFVIDAFTPLDVAIAVMYVVVIMLSAQAWPRRGVIVTACGCMALTVAAYVASHVTSFSGPAFGRLIISLVALGITAFLTLHIQAATVALLQRENALHRSQAQLAHATRVTTLGELAASIAHEVNQPLAAISANGEACLRWMNRPQPDMPEAGAAVRRMLEASGRASAVIRRIRLLARKTDPQQLPLDLNEVAEETALLVRRELASHNVTLSLDLDPGLPPVRGDRVQLQQVIINLLMNGMQAMSQCAPGQALLALRTVAVAPADDAGGGAALLGVADSGPGIAAEDAGRLFEAFFTTKSDGMGMGLAICRSIVEAHGGRIWALPDSRSGATMQFQLPALAG